MEGKTLDTSQLTKIMIIAIVATLVLVAAVSALYVIKIFSNDNNDDTFLPDENIIKTTIPTQIPSPVPDANTPEISDPTIYQTADQSSNIFTMPVDKSADDKVRVVDNYTPNDPYFSPPEFNTTSADYSLSLDFYKLLYENKIKDMKYTPLSVVVNVGKGPLVVNFKISNVKVTTGKSSTGGGSSPKYSSGVHTFTGVPTEVPFYSFLNIRVSDNMTGELLKEGGFSRQFPSTDEQDIFIYETGEFRIDLYGSGLDTDLKIFSGTVPENPDAIPVDSAASVKFSELGKSEESSNAKNTAPPEEEWW
ncbi:hypothetical protein L1994_02855 [Methanomicrobium antiquum]|uniref:Uncharacterized protein n=1 Tax=Methanomicrobium antiquum TaxID=487686 RepID=A0AAF0JM20_9EURY|nr:hypothetical protein [Methanomicrobium antiquum]WFN37344.1 hypothetical protein L1994_02855 [Methanomicrobium antiquum]